MADLHDPMCHKAADANATLLPTIWYDIQNFFSYSLANNK